MKILQIIYESSGSPFGFGGAGVRAYEIYRRLSGRHDVTFLCMKYPGAKDGEIRGLRHVFAGTESTSLTRSVLAFTTKAAWFVRKYGDDFDVVVENFLPSTPFFSAWLTGKPVVLQVQGVMERHSFRKFNLLYSLPMFLSEKFYPGIYDKFIFVSDITRQKVTQGMRKKINLSRVVPNGVNGELFEVTPLDGDYLLFFSRIDVYTKGLDVLLSAFSLLDPRYGNLKLVLAGHESDSFEKLVSGLAPEVRDKVEYAGFVEGERKKSLLSGARLVLMPSRHESYPISILEAAACGKPVVVSDIAELRFVRENNFGVSFPTGSVEGLRSQIELLLGNEEIRHELGLHGREFARNFSWDDVAEEFEKILESVA